jgi:hypothetical protein
MAAIINFAINSTFITFLIIISAFFVTWIIYLQWQLWTTRKRLKIFFNGSRAEDLEGVISEQIKRLRQAEQGIKEMNKFSDYLEKMAQKSIQKVGVVRFNPFKETGSDQSFSVALLDPDNNGLTISGLFVREGTRLYVKPVAAGESKYPLTNEEKQAIEDAKKDWGIKKINK